jgi:hypothetical protein
MKKIFAIAWKDTRLRFSGWFEWMFFLIMPIFFTMVLAGGTGPSSDNRVRLDVVDQAGTPLSTDLLSALEKSSAVHPLPVTLTKAESDFSQKKISAVLIIPAGFDLAHLQQGNLQLELRQQPNNMNAPAVRQTLLTPARPRLRRCAHSPRQANARLTSTTPWRLPKRRSVKLRSASLQCKAPPGRRSSTTHAPTRPPGN